MKIKVEVLIPNSAERLSITNEPKDISPKFNGPILKISQELPNGIAFGSSWGERIANAEAVSFVGRKIENIPNMHEIKTRTTSGLQIILKGNDPNAVIHKRITTKAILQRGPASIGESKNIKVQANLSLGSMFLNQPVFPETYCPIGTFLKISIY